MDPQTPELLKKVITDAAASAAYSPRPIIGALTLNVTAAGNSKVGTVIIYLVK